MNAILLILTVFSVSLQGVTVKSFGKSNQNKGLYLFSALSRLAGVIFFVLTAGRLILEWEVLPYAIAFSIFYGIGVIFNFLSINCGPLSLTSLITSYSLMLPTAFGLFFLHDPISMGLIPGLILLLVSLFLINQKSGTDGASISFKWGIFVFLAFIGNGFCSIVQSMQQRAFAGSYKNEFMIMALLFFVLITGIISLCTERKEIVNCTKKGWLPAVVCGIANALMNLLVMILQNRIPVSVLFPLMSGSGLVLTYFLSRFLYKEKLSRRQLVGFVLGTLSVVFLNI